ncbi:MAG: hypothetical protein KGD63_00835 [Candidatus Lokiarchaeota archaeon]|nr:hypothetical protein [Candidatus Lokiarchaeota archaeon]
MKSKVITSFFLGGIILIGCIVIFVSVQPNYKRPGSLELSTNAGNPDNDGYFLLDWTVSEGAQSYSIYESSTNITSIDGDTDLVQEELTINSVSLYGYGNGTYYFVIVAVNHDVYTLSNCINVNIILPPPLDPNSEAIIINHNSIKLGQIPEYWINTTKNMLKVHYAHTSHGGQITTGLNRIYSSNSTFNINRELRSLPTDPDTLCIFDGQEGEDYITPELYWATSEGINDTYDVIDHNPTINVSIFAFCTQMGYYSEVEVLEYLQQMDEFEEYYRNHSRYVRFVYLTGNADRGDYAPLEGTLADENDQNPDEGYQRYLNNQIVRNYCIENNKTLFDFADIECYTYDVDGNPLQHSTYNYNNGSAIVNVPMRHLSYSNNSQAAHTSYENCENKGKAFWWLLTRIAGWAGI